MSEESLHFFHFAAETLMSMVGLSLWELDVPRQTVALSPLLQKKTGLPARMAFADFRDAFVIAEDAETAATALGACLAGSASNGVVLFRTHDLSGQVLWIREQTAVLATDANGSPTRVAALVQDVTTQKLQEDKLLAENALRARVSRQAGLGVWEWDVRENWVRFNADQQNLLGYPPEDLEGPLEEVFSRLHPDDVSRVSEHVKQYVANPKGMFLDEMRFKHADGHYLWLQDMGTAVDHDEEGRATRIIGGVLNVDARVKAERKLQETLQEMAGYTEKLQGEVELVKASRVAMFDSNPHVMFLFDGAGNPLECNPAAVDTFGFASKAELLQNFTDRIKEWIPKFQPDGRISISFIENFRLTMERGYNTFETEVLLDGKRTPFDVICKRIPYEGAYAMVAYLTDLSRVRRAQENLDKQDKLMRALHSMAASLVGAEPADFEEIIHAGMELLGDAADADRMRIWRNYEEDGELHCREIYSWSRVTFPYASYNEEMRYAELPYWQQMMLEHKVLNAYTVLLPSAEKHALQTQNVLAILVVPIYIRDSFWGFVGFDDCTNQRTFSGAEEKLLQSAGNMLVTSILRNEMTGNLIKAREDALLSAKAKSDFLSRMSHEIRTPMNAIIGMAALARKVRDLDKIEEYLVKIDSSSKQLLGIINDVLDMSKIEADKFEIGTHPFDFEKMLQNVFNVMQVKFDEKRQDFRYDFKKPFARKLVNDELRLSQVLLNLLSNAVKFTPECGVITLKVRETVTGENTSVLQVEVADNGIGVPKDRQEKLFQSFEQADGSITRQFGGTGLGLAITKKIINLMGGDIWVESEIGEGASFIFEIPVTWGETLGGRATPLHLRKGLRTLVVDDAEDVLEYLRGILEGFDLVVDTAPGAVDALEMAEKSVAENAPYDVVFVDWHMPGMNGGETAHALRAVLGEQVIIVMISVSDWGEIATEAHKSGVSLFLQKPILPSSLYDALVQCTARTMECSAAAPEEEEAHWPGKHVLLVEDIEINREIVIGLLDGTGLVVTSAEDGLEAVNLFSQNPDLYDIILMDVQMPVLDGISATRKIRSLATPNAKIIPIIAMTANAFKEDEKECLAAGMNAHIAKPLELDVLYRVLGRFLTDPEIS